MRLPRWLVILSRFAILFALMFFILKVSGGTEKAPVVKEITIDELYTGINSDQVQSLNVDGNTGEVTGEFKDKSLFANFDHCLPCGLTHNHTYMVWV